MDEYNQQLLEAENRRNNYNEDGTVGENKQYLSIITRFKKWVDERRNDPRYIPTFQLPADKYISRGSIVSFYLQWEMERDKSAKSSSNTKNALEQLAQAEMSPLTELHEHQWFVNVRNTVNQTLNRKKGEKRKADLIDPQNIKPDNVYSARELHMVQTDLLQEANESRDSNVWKERNMVYAVLSTTLLRWDSGQEVRLHQLDIEKDKSTTGIKTPHDLSEWEETAESDWMLSIIIPPGIQKKKNKPIAERKAEMVATYRHKQLERCAIGLIALKLFEDLNTTKKLSFLQNPPDGHVNHFDINLLEDKYSTTSDGIKMDLKRVGIGKKDKVTHFRSFGTKFCTTQGLGEDTVTTMTKHRQGTYSQSYRAEISIPVATTLAGFVPGAEKYFVPRANIKFPQSYNHSEIISILFPDYIRYKTEFASETSITKHRESAKKLIYELLPWLSNVLLQDGILWIKKYPQISGVSFLTNMMSKKKAITAFGCNYVNWVKTDGIRQLKELLDTTNSETSNNENTVTGTNLADLEPLIVKQDTMFEYMKRCLPNPSALIKSSSSTTIPPRLPNINQRLNFSNTPVIPIIWNINEYETVKKLWSCRVIHLHHEIEKDPPTWIRPKGKKHEAGPLYKKKDQWCKIACIHKHINKTFRDLKIDKSWETELEAAELLDFTERKKMTLNQYVSYIKNLEKNK